MFVGNSPETLLAEREMIRTACCVDRRARDTQRRVSELTSEGTKEKHNMYRIRNITIALTTALALSACSETPVGPGTTSVSTLQSGPAFAKSVSGTGLVLDNVTGLSLPLIGHIGTVTINQAIITQLGVVQDLAGNIIGVDANGVLQLTGGVLGTDVNTQMPSTRGCVPRVWRAWTSNTDLAGASDHRNSIRGGDRAVKQLIGA